MDPVRLLARRRAPMAALVAVSFAALTDLLVYTMAVPILPRYGHALGASPFAIGVLLGLYAVGLLIGAPAFGLLTDRYGRRRPLLVGAGGLVAASALFAVGGTFTVLLVARLLQGVAAGATWTAGVALVADVFGPEDRGKAMGTVLTSMSAGMVIGPPFGGALFDHGGIHLPFLAVIGLTISSWALQAALVVEPPAPERAAPPVLALLSDRSLVVVAAAIAVSAGGLSLLEPVIPLYLASSMGASAAAVGVIFGVETLTYGLASGAFGTVADRWDRWWMIALGMVVMAVIVPGLVLPRTLPGEGALMALYGVAFAFTIVPTFPELAAIVDSHGGGAYGLAYAVFNLAYGVGMVVGPVAGGLLLALYNVAAALAVTGLVLLCAGPLLVWYRLASRARPASEARHRGGGTDASTDPATRR